MEKPNPWHPSLRVPNVSRGTSPPPPITRPSGQFESDDEQVLKGPKVAQLLRTVIKLRDGHKDLSDRMAELTLELKSVKYDYDTLRCSLGVKIECLEKRVEKGNQ